MFSVGYGELWATLETVFGLDPRRLFVQDVEEFEHELLGGDRMVKYGYSLVVVGSDRCTVLYQATTQVAISVLIREEQRFLKWNKVKFIKNHISACKLVELSNDKSKLFSTNYSNKISLK